MPRSSDATALTRRRLLRALGAAAAASALVDRAAAARADDLVTRLRAAARTGAAVRLPAGEITLMGLELPDGAHLVGVPGKTVLKLTGLGPLLSATMAKNITLESLVLDGAGAYLSRERGLVDFSDVAHLAIRGCTIRRSGAHGVNLLRCGGVFAQNTVETAADAGVHSLDSLGFDFDNNLVRACADNGVRFWASAAGRYDGSRIRNNRIEDIDNRSGGDGPYGNGVAIYLSGSIRIENNRILRCAYTAVRNNGGHAIAVIGNDCRGCGERAMYAEFGARNSLFRNNRIADAGAGIGVANSDRGTDGALVEGNEISGLSARHPDPAFGPRMLWLTAIAGEKNTQIVGNRLTGPMWIGVSMGGWRENIRVEANDIFGADYAVVASVGEGAGDGYILRNKIRNARRAAIAAATDGPTFAPGDLAKDGAHAYPRLTVAGNIVE